MQRIVGIGEMVISNNIEDTIKTFALSSCVAVVAYSSFRKVGGMIHIALPKPPTNEKEGARLCYYASTGIPLFINQLCGKYSCLKGELKITLYGGANSSRTNDVFNIGRKNIEASKNILSEMYLSFDDHQTGENVSRTIELELLTGQVSVHCQKINI